MPVTCSHEPAPPGQADPARPGSGGRVILQRHREPDLTRRLPHQAARGLVREAWPAVPGGPVLMSLNMLIGTDAGLDYTGAEFDARRTEAGFRKTEVVPLAGLHGIGHLA